METLRLLQKKIIFIRRSVKKIKTVDMYKVRNLYYNVFILNHEM